MPVTITRPRHSRSIRTARSKRSSSRSTSERIAAASVWRTKRASARSAVVFHRRCGLAPRGGVDARELAKQGFELVEAQCVGRVAPGARGVLVDLHEHGVHARGDAGRGHRLDVLGQAEGDAVTGAGQLQAVRHVEDDRVAEGAQHGEGPHVHDQVVVAEAHAALGDQNRGVARGRDLGHGVAHVGGRQKLPLLDVDYPAGTCGGHEQVGLPREERRDLQDVGDRGRRRRLAGLVDVGEDRQSGADLDLVERREAGVETGTPERRARGAVALSNDALKTTGTPHRSAISLMASAMLSTWAGLSITHGPAMKASGAPPPIVSSPTRTGATDGAGVVGESDTYRPAAETLTGASVPALCCSAAPMKLAKSGCGRSGRDWNSGGTAPPRTRGATELGDLDELAVWRAPDTRMPRAVTSDS
jgi:hypothetical protein